MITADGWLDWAERLPGVASHVNGGVNDVRGIFLHSAEGYADNLLKLATSGPLSWHASNLMGGRLIQHFPFTAQCWHATAANNHYVGMEHEGVYTREPSLNEAQIANAVRVIQDLAAWKGWTPEHTGAVHQTLWEHREVTLIGGSPTACPSGRIPWAEILRRLAVEQRQWLYGNEAAGEEIVGNQIFIWHGGVIIDKIGDEAGDFPGQRAHNEGGTFVIVEP